MNAVLDDVSVSHRRVRQEIGVNIKTYHFEDAEGEQLYIYMDPFDGALKIQHGEDTISLNTKSAEVLSALLAQYLATGNI